MYGIMLQPLATVLAFDPGGTTGWCAMSVKPEVLVGANNSVDTLQSNLEVFKYGQIDCGTRHGETGVGMNRGHGALNLPGENRGVSEMIHLALDMRAEEPVLALLSSLVRLIA